MNPEFQFTEKKESIAGVWKTAGNFSFEQLTPEIAKAISDLWKQKYFDEVVLSEKSGSKTISWQEFAESNFDLTRVAAPAERLLEKEIASLSGGESLACHISIPIGPPADSYDCAGIEKILSIDPTTVKLQVGGTAVFPAPQKIIKDRDALELFANDVEARKVGSDYDWKLKGSDWQLSFFDQVEVERRRRYRETAQNCLDAAKETVAPFKEEVVSAQKNFDELYRKYSNETDPDLFKKKLDRISKFLTPDSLEIGKKWYQEAHTVALDLSTKYGFSIEQTSGVIAVLSPGVSWPLNKKGATLMISNFPELPKKGIAGYRKNINKAYEILKGLSIADAINPKTSPKVFAFYNGIVHGGASNYVTIDFHMINLWRNLYVPVAQHTSIAPKTREAIKEMVLQLAREHGMSASEIQAALWEAWREHAEESEQPQMSLFSSRTAGLSDVYSIVHESETYQGNPDFEELESAWAGGVADFGNPDAAIVIQALGPYYDYKDILQTAVEKFLGDPFPAFRLISADQLEEWKSGSDMPAMGVSTSREFAESFRGFAPNKGRDLILIELSVPASAVIMLGKEEEQELVIDANAISFHEVKQAKIAALWSHSGKKWSDQLVDLYALEYKYNLIRRYGDTEFNKRIKNILDNIEQSFFAVAEKVSDPVKKGIGLWLEQHDNSAQNEGWYREWGKQYEKLRASLTDGLKRMTNAHSMAQVSAAINHAVNLFHFSGSVLSYVGRVTGETEYQLQETLNNLTNGVFEGKWLEELGEAGFQKKASALVLFHGTSSAFLEKIKVSGLIDPYLTNDPQIAAEVAEYAAEETKSEPVVLSVSIPDSANLKTDSHMWDEPFWQVKEKADAWMEKHGGDIPSDWETSLSVVRSCKYEGSIPFENLHVRKAAMEKEAALWDVEFEEPSQFGTGDLKSLIPVVYELEYKYSMAKTWSFKGMEKRKDNILKNLSDVLDQVCDHTIEILEPVFSTWLSHHALTDPLEWAEGRLHPMEDDYESPTVEDSLDDIWEGYYQYTKKDFPALMRSALKNRAKLPVFAYWVKYLPKDIKGFTLNDLFEMDNFSSLLGQYPDTAEDILKEFYAFFVFPHWYKYWKGRGIDQVRKDNETAYDKLRGATSVEDKFAAINMALNAVHVNGSMLEYVADRTGDNADDLEMLLGKMSNLNTSKLDEELSEAGFSKTSKIKFSRWIAWHARHPGKTAAVEFTDRYDALGIPYPDPETICPGECEGTGWVPIPEDESDEEFKALWQEAEEKEHADDGWHFVKCPECHGTGIKKNSSFQLIAELASIASYIAVFNDAKSKIEEKVEASKTEAPPRPSARVALELFWKLCDDLRPLANALHGRPVLKKNIKYIKTVFSILRQNTTLSWAYKLKGKEEGWGTDTMFSNAAWNYLPQHMANIEKMLGNIAKLEGEVSDITQLEKSFKHGPFKIVNKWGFTKNQYAGPIAVLDMASEKIKAAGFDDLLYGTVQLIKTEHHGTSTDVGWYVRAEDLIRLGVTPEVLGVQYPDLNPGDKATPAVPINAVKTLIHEFGHRFWYQRLSQEQRNEYVRMFQAKAGYISKEDLKAMWKALVESEGNIQAASSAFSPELAVELKARLEAILQKRSVPLSRFQKWMRLFKVDQQEENSRNLAYDRLLPRSAWNKVTDIKFDFVSEGGIGGTHSKPFSKSVELSVTPYGNTDPVEDFAEVFAFYVLGRPIPEDVLERFHSVVPRTARIGKLECRKISEPEMKGAAWILPDGTVWACHSHYVLPVEQGLVGPVSDAKDARVAVREGLKAGWIRVIYYDRELSLNVWVLDEANQKKIEDLILTHKANLYYVSEESKRIGREFTFKDFENAGFKIRKIRTKKGTARTAGIYLKDNDLVFEWTPTQKDVVSLSPGKHNQTIKVPYLNEAHNFPIYSIFAAHTSETLNDILKILKGQLGNLDPNLLTKFLKKAAIFIQKYLHPDVILVIPSTSDLTKRFVQVLSEYLSSPEVIYRNLTVLEKNPASEVTLVAGAPPAAVEIVTRLKKEAENVSQPFPIKKVPVMHRKWVANLFKLSVPTEKFAGKSVLVIDDVLTSGSSFQSAFAILSLSNPSEVMGLSLIKIR